VGFQLIIVCSGCLGRSPEKRIVVREGGEQHAKEEKCCYSWSAIKVLQRNS
jgi:hypothetical protein